MIIFLVAYNHQRKHIDDNPAYSFFTKAIFIKILGAFSFNLVYLLYYHGAGDTTGYFLGGKVLVNLFFENPSAYFKILFGDMSREVLSNFSASTGFPTFTHDYGSFAINRITSIFVIFGFKSYFTTTLLFATFFFIGSWKLYLMVCELYPKYYKSLAFAVLLFPSVLFWASGISKDTVALSMTGWFAYSFHNALIKKRKVFKSGISMILSGFIIMSVKSYILVALLPGAFIWMGWDYMSRIKNPVTRLIIKPAVGLAFFGISLGILTLLGDFLGEYGSLERIIKKAIETYEDHIRFEQYGLNFYSLGTFDGTIGNFLSKTPKAIIAGLFRPFIWEARNIVMFVAGVENLFFLVMVFYLFWRTGFVKTFKLFFDEPMVIFSISFAMIFAFAVGISTGNFGALVRLKTPLIPFLTVGLFILFNKSMELRDQNRKTI